MTSELIDYVGRYGGNCRDCADNDGVCDRGTPCDPKVFRAAIEHTIKALEYGIKHGFIENPFTRAIPDVPELVRYRLHWHDFDTADMEIDNVEGEYVLHSQAAVIIAVLSEAEKDAKESRDDWKKLAKDLKAEVDRLRGALKDISDFEGVPYRIEIYARSALTSEKQP